MRILLTKDQCEYLQYLEARAVEGAHEEKRGFIFAQVFPKQGHMTVGFIENERAVEIKKIVESDPK